MGNLAWSAWAVAPNYYRRTNQDTADACSVIRIHASRVSYDLWDSSESSGILRELEVSLFYEGDKKGENATLYLRKDARYVELF